jgi:hypothetical protein
MKKWFYSFLKLLFVFSVLFDINFKFLPSLTTSRLAFLALLLLVLIKKKRFPVSSLNYLAVLFVILFFSIWQYLFSGDFTQPSRIIWFSLYSILTPFLFINFIKNRNEFFYLIALAVTIQAVLTILSYLLPSVKNVFNSLIIYSSNFDATNLLRAMGFASVGGASFSVIQSTGVISFLVLDNLNKFHFLKRFLIWVSILLIFISIFFIGRTGLFICIISFIIYFVSLKLKLKSIAITAAFLFLASQINYVNLVQNLTSGVDGFNTDLFVNWIESSFKLKDNETTEALNEMPVPPLSFETVFGTGRVRDISGLENASGNDSGYIQTYYSLGLILAIIFYVTFFSFLIYQIKMQKKFNDSKQFVLYLLVFVIFVLEFKEPFIFHYSFPFFVLSSILIFRKNSSNNTSKIIIPKEIL